MSKPTATIGSLVLATVYSLGITVTAILLISIGVVVFQPWFQESWIVEAIQIRPDGEPLIVSYPSSNYSDQSYRTLDGQSLDDPGDRVGLTGTSLRILDGQSERWSGAWDRRMVGMNDGRRPAGYWYFVYETQFKERGYFIGIDSLTKLPIGFMGTSGFSRTVPNRDGQFVIDRKQVSDIWMGLISTRYRFSRGVPNVSGSDGTLPAWLVYTISEGKLLEVNLRDRRVRTLIESDQIVSMEIIQQGVEGRTVEGNVTTRTQPKQLLAIRYADRVDLIDPMADDPSQAVSYPMPEEQRITKEGRVLLNLTLFLTESGTLIFRWNTAKNLEDNLSYRLTWVEPDGRVSRTENIELAGHPQSISAWLAVVSPVGGTVLATVIPFVMAYAMTTGIYEIEFPEALGRILVQVWPALLSAYMASGLAVWLCLRRQRRYGMSGTGMWAVFVAIFGLPGLLAYVWSRHWPPLEPCAECGQPASQARDGCHRCGESFSRPARQGTEVFA